MKRINDLQEIQHLALEILKSFNEFCEEYHLEYYLAYGTLIGTIRHKGFIPWDDDIDLWMKRETFNIMVKKFPEWGKSHGLYLNAVDTVDNYNRVHAQVCMEKTKLTALDRKNDFQEGYFIDIFPLEGTPDNPVQRWWRLTELQTLKNISSIVCYRMMPGEKGLKKQMRNILAHCTSFIPVHKAMLRYQKVAEKTSCDGSQYLQAFGVSGTKGRNIVIPAEFFSKSIKLPYEDIQGQVPVGYDSILRMIYGDYMQLPPEKSRKPHHNFVLEIED